MPKLLTLALALIFSTSFSQIQKERSYIVMKSDTIYGLIKYQNLVNNPATINFRKTEVEAWMEYSVNDISAFFTLETAFEARPVRADFSSALLNDIKTNSFQNIIRDSTLFLRVLFKSEIATLYSFLDADNKNHFFIMKGSGKIDELVKKCTVQDDKILCKNVYWQTLRFHFNDCPTIDDNTIKRIDLNEDDLKRVFVNYVKCKNGKVATTQESGKKPILISAFVSPGLTTVTFDGPTAPAGSKLPGLVNAKFQSVLCVQAGAAFEHIPRLSAKWSLGLELGVRTFSLESTNEFYSSSTSSTYVQHYSMRPIYIRLNPSLRYYFKTEGMTPFLHAGFPISYAASFSSSYDVTQTYAAGFATSTHDGALNPDEFRKVEFGYFLGAGIRKSRIDLELRYERGDGMIQGPVSFASATMNVGLYFRYRLNKD